MKTIFKNILRNKKKYRLPNSTFGELACSLHWHCAPQPQSLTQVACCRPCVVKVVTHISPEKDLLTCAALVFMFFKRSLS